MFLYIGGAIIPKLANTDFTKITIEDKSENAVLGFYNKTYTLNGHEHKILFEGIEVGYGVRGFIRCPRCHERCNCLYTPNFIKGVRYGEILGCRKCFDFNYFSQQVTKTKFDYEAYLMNIYGKEIDSTFKLYKGIDTPFPAKPDNVKYRKYLKYFKLYYQEQRKANNKWLKSVEWINKYK